MLLLGMACERPAQLTDCPEKVGSFVRSLIIGVVSSQALASNDIGYRLSPKSDPDIPEYTIRCDHLKGRVFYEVKMQMGDLSDDSQIWYKPEELESFIRSQSTKFFALAFRFGDMEDFLKATGFFELQTKEVCEDRATPFVNFWRAVADLDDYQDYFDDDADSSRRKKREEDVEEVKEFKLVPNLPF